MEESATGKSVSVSFRVPVVRVVHASRRAGEAKLREGEMFFLNAGASAGNISSGGCSSAGFLLGVLAEETNGF